MDFIRSVVKENFEVKRKIFKSKSSRLIFFPFSGFAVISALEIFSSSENNCLRKLNLVFMFNSDIPCWDFSN